jgi:hypothetical protein
MGSEASTHTRTLVNQIIDLLDPSAIGLPPHPTPVPTQIGSGYLILHRSSVGKHEASPTAVAMGLSMAAFLLVAVV